MLAYIKSDVIIISKIPPEEPYFKMTIEEAFVFNSVMNLPIIYI